MSLLGFCSSFVTCLFKPFAFFFFYKLGCFLFLFFKGIIYILDMSPLLSVGITFIFLSPWFDNSF